MNKNRLYSKLSRQVKFLREKGPSLYLDDFLNGQRVWSLQNSKQNFYGIKTSISGASTEYLSIVDSAVRNLNHFRRFRSNLQYMTILEHVDKELGQEYLNTITRYGTATPKLFHFCKKDVCGPLRFSYEGLGRVSPTNLRYAKVALDIEALFGGTSDFNVAEIGIGFGGQCAALFNLGSFKSYALFDLAPVLALAKMYLEVQNLPLERIVMGELGSSKTSFDLVISNYAFSELSRELQESYLTNVILNSARGYVIYNNFSSSALNPMSAEEFVALVPGSKVLEEFPLTHSENKLIIWGHESAQRLISSS